MTAQILELPTAAAADPVCEDPVCEDPGLACDTCGGERFVMRPTETRETNVTRYAYGPGWRLEEDVAVELVELGGVDACPDCAARAEAAFQTGKGNHERV